MNKLVPVACILALGGCSWFASDKTSAPAPVIHAAPASVWDSTSPGDIMAVQQKLADANLYHGAIDGRWGPATEAALRTYQQQHNLNPTGKLDDETHSVMFPAKTD
jgi:peptidoglycan hydrolase-like protein with peptidoglycan-binding domain